VTKTPSLVQDCLGFTPGSGITLDRATNATFTVVELPIQGSQRTYTIELFDELDPTKTKAFELTLSLKCKTHSKLEFAQKYVEVIYEDGDPIDTNEIALPALTELPEANICNIFTTSVDTILSTDNLKYRITNQPAVY